MTSIKQFHEAEKANRCVCNNDNETYRIIENYHSILDRKQPFLSSWKVYTDNETIHFTHGEQCRKGTDALLVQSNCTSLINPWYDYVHVNQQLLSLLKQDHNSKIFELVLLENNCSDGSCQYALAIIECPCLGKLKTYCTYCQLILTATAESHTSPRTWWRDDERQATRNWNRQLVSHDPQCPVQLLSQSIETLRAMNEHDRILLQSFPRRDCLSQALADQSIVLLHEDEDRQCSSPPNDDGYSVNSSLSFHCLSQEPYLLQNVSSASHSNGNSPRRDRSFRTTTQRATRETQTKLFAIMLPQSPFSEMTEAEIEERTSLSITRTCQVNTLSYLIKINECSTDVRCPIMDDRHTPQMDRLSTTSAPFPDERHSVSIDGDSSALVIKIPTFERRRDKRTNSSSKNEKIFSEEEADHSTGRIFMSSAPLKCINACNVVDFNGLAALKHTSSSNVVPLASDQVNEQQAQNIHVNRPEHPVIQRTTETKSFDYFTAHDVHSKNNNNNNREQLTSGQRKPYAWVLHQRRRRRNKKRVYAFLQRLHRRQKLPRVQLFASDQCPFPFSTTTDGHSTTPSRSTRINTTDHKSPFSTRRKSINNSHLSTSPSRYKAHDHLIIARASKNSTYDTQLQTLLKNPDSTPAEVIGSQLMLASTDNYRSICILLDDANQSDDDRSLFLQDIYGSLSNTLKQIVANSTMAVTCMNLVFFNNSMCDLTKMQRLRLIDTGKTIVLRPSCETALRTSDDIDVAIDRLSTKMFFAHQILIVNFYCAPNSLSGSFLFLHLAPVCPVRSTGLLTNLNSTTYAVMNLIRQLKRGHSLSHRTAKWCRLNDYALSRLLKSYLFSSQQSLTVLTVKAKHREQLTSTSQ